MTERPFRYLSVLLGLLKRMVEPEVAASFEQHLIRKTTDLRKRRGRAAAAAFSLFQVLQIFLVTIHHHGLWRGGMLKNHFLSAARRFRKRKAGTILSVSGLAIAIPCTLFLFFHVKDELEYDSFFPKADRLFRIAISARSSHGYRHWATGSFPMGPLLEQSLPEIQACGRLRGSGPVVFRFSGEDAATRSLSFKQGYYADAGILRMFDLPFIQGDPASALREIDSVVLTASAAEKCFGSGIAVGRTLTDVSSRRDYKITGIIADLPHNSHLEFDFLASMSSVFPQISEEALQHRIWKAVYTYALLRSDRNSTVVEGKLPDFVGRFLAGYAGSEEIWRLQPIRSIHLHSRLENEPGSNSDMAYVLIFSGTALLIILIAVMNFVNIIMAQAIQRMKDVGIRKVLGAGRGRLIRQHMGETLFLTWTGATIGILIFHLAVPLYNALTGKHLESSQLFSPGNLILFMALTFALGLLGGIYPALHIANFRPANSSGLGQNRGLGINPVRKALVVFQFAISVFLIFSTLTIFRQVALFRGMDLGFEQHSLLAVSLHGELQSGVRRNLTAVKSELLGLSAVLGVAGTSVLPGDRYSMEPLRPLGLPRSVRLPEVRVLRVDHDYLRTMGISLSEGRDFVSAPQGGLQYLLNRTAVRALDLENPIGLPVRGLSGEGRIVGVMADSHFASLHSSIEPLVLCLLPEVAEHLIVRYRDADIPGFLDGLRTTLKKWDPGLLFQYVFIDQHLNRLYRSEARMGVLFNLFAAVAIVISCFGLFGLSIHSAETRTKEFGIRRVLGASGTGLFMRLSGQFMGWVGLAVLLALPGSFAVMTWWLRNFANRVNVGIGAYLVAAGVTALVAFATVCFHSARAAAVDPVRMLRHE